MEYATEIINISKIKEGFYIGDRFAGTNLEVIMHFKITHIINAAAAQVINTFEPIGIKYLSLIWADNSSQKLFTTNDKIVDRIIGFIDEALTNGEGLLVHSVKGQNRVCIVVVIYLMKKYKWGLMKCIDFLHSKKADVNITKAYLSQLAQYEMKLVKMGMYSHDWNEEGIEDAEEMLLRNTFVNGLPYKPTKKSGVGNKKCSKPKIGWADFNPFNAKDSLIHPNPCRDLIMQREIQPVTSHLRLSPGKSCVRVRSSSEDYGKQANNYNKIKCVKYEECNDEVDNGEGEEVKVNGSLLGAFNRPLPREEEKSTRDMAVPNDAHNQMACSANIPSAKQNPNVSNSYEDSSTSNDKASLGQSTKHISNRPELSNKERVNNFKAANSKKSNDNPALPKRPSTVEHGDNPHKNFGKKAFNENNKYIDGNVKGYILKSRMTYSLGSNSKKKVNEHYNIESIQKPFASSIERRGDSNQANTPTDQLKPSTKQKMAINNYIKDFSMKKNNSNDTLLPYSSQMSKEFKLSKSLTGNDVKILNYQSRVVPMKVSSTSASQNYILAYDKPLNNFDPSLMKKSQNMFLRATHSFEKGPIKLSKECMFRKPLTPDQMLYINAMQPEKSSKGFNKNNYNEIYGTLVRKPGNSTELNYFRPLTAPQKSKQKRKKSGQRQKRSSDEVAFSNLVYLNPVYPAMKRLPSPMIQSSQLMRSQKLGTGFMKSPHLMLKPNVLAINPYQNNPIIK